MFTAIPTNTTPRNIPKPKSKREEKADIAADQDLMTVTSSQKQIIPDEVSTGPGTQNDVSIQLNNSIQTMIKLLREIDTNTGKTVNAISSSGNMFRR